MCGITPYDQAVEIFTKILHELSRVGLGAADVIQNRIYVTDISRGDEVGRAHGEFFAEHRPLMHHGRGQRPDRPPHARRDRNRRLRGLA